MSARIRSGYAHQHRLETLTAGIAAPSTGAVFIDLEAVMPAAISDHVAPWAMFHGSARDGLSSDRHGAHSQRRRSRPRNPVVGQLQTTFLQNVPNTDDQVLKALLDTDSAPDKKAMTTLMALIIRNETRMFGINPRTTTAPALGGRTANLVRASMRDWSAILEMPRYAASVKAEVFKARTHEALDLTHPDFSRGEA